MKDRKKKIEGSWLKLNPDMEWDIIENIIKQERIKSIDDKIVIWQFLHDKFKENNIKGRFFIDQEIEKLNIERFKLES